jgi:hypothetical protein
MPLGRGQRRTIAHAGMEFLSTLSGELPRRASNVRNRLTTRGAVRPNDPAILSAIEAHQSSCLPSPWGPSPALGSQEPLNSVSRARVQGQPRRHAVRFPSYRLCRFPWPIYGVRWAQVPIGSQYLNVSLRRRRISPEWLLRTTPRADRRPSRARSNQTDTASCPRAAVPCMWQMMRKSRRTARRPDHGRLRPDPPRAEVQRTAALPGAGETAGGHQPTRPRPLRSRSRPPSGT